MCALVALARPSRFIDVDVPTTSRQLYNSLSDDIHNSIRAFFFCERRSTTRDFEKKARAIYMHVIHVCHMIFNKVRISIERQA
jgi:hypothetical protein